VLTTFKNFKPLKPNVARVKELEGEGADRVTGANTVSLMTIAQDWNAVGFTISGRG
jgi:hypothetical protein